MFDTDRIVDVDNEGSDNPDGAPKIVEEDPVDKLLDEN